MSGFRVLAEQCDQCLFTEDRIVTRSRAADVLKECRRDDAHFVCHKSQLAGGELACCRGFYDANPGATNLMRVAGRLGMVEFVAEADLG